jgi:O-antigen ligase
VTALAEPVAPSRTSADVGDQALLPWAVGTTVCLLPFLVPPGPGNTALADAAMAGSILLGALWLVHSRLPVRLPYAVGVALMVAGGALAGALSAATAHSTLVLLQDLFLLMWAATLALGVHEPSIVVIATRAWCRLAPVYAAVGVLSYIIGFQPFSGVTESNGVRASYTFGDPNVAANFMVMSLFVMAACQRPRALSTRWVSYALVLVAMGFTGSNGGMLTLLVGALLSVTLTVHHRRGSFAGAVSLIITVLLVVLAAVLVMPRVDLGALREKAAESVPLLRDSFGRSSSSVSERQVILEEGFSVFLTTTGTGVGPAETKASLARAQEPYVKEAHNDYLATLLERGLVGALGLLVLGVAVAVRCGRLLFYDLPGPYAEAVPRPWLLVVIAPVMATAGGFYEVLHFRHLWTWLGLIAVLALVAERPRREPRS